MLRANSNGPLMFGFVLSSSQGPPRFRLAMSKTKKTRSEFVAPEERSTPLSIARGIKMSRPAHAYVRGSTASFYRWLESSTGRLVPKGPDIWICGDCHVGNLGPVADARGRVEIAIRDLDQTVRGNPAHDLIRLGLSLATAIRGSDLPGVTTAIMLEEMIQGYTCALANGRSSGRPPKSVASILDRSLRRRWHHLAEERIKDVRPGIPLGRKFWPISPGRAKRN
jgi:uncharacterized protein (DUF2252 family)